MKTEKKGENAILGGVLANRSPKRQHESPTNQIGWAGLTFTALVPPKILVVVAESRCVSQESGLSTPAKGAEPLVSIGRRRHGRGYEEEGGGYGAGNPARL
jgi:hypothetical protein